MQTRTRNILRLALGVVVAAAMTAFALVLVLGAVGSGEISRDGRTIIRDASPQAFWSYVAALSAGGLVAGVLGGACLYALGRERLSAESETETEVVGEVEKDAA